MKPGIIVLGGRVQGLGILRILGESGVTGILIDNTQINISRHSKYCRKFYRVEDNNLLEFLSSLGKKKKYFNWLIFPTNDYHVKILSTNKKHLEEYFRISTDYWISVEKCYDKRQTYELATKLNIPIPLTWMPNSLEKIPFDEINYPCIIKPAVMHTFYKKFKRKVFLCRDKNELIKNYNRAFNIIPSEEIIIQDIVPGNSNHQYSACFLFFNNMPVITLTAQRARQHPINFGNATTYAETVDYPELMKFGKMLLKEIKYNGLCEVEFKYDSRDNQLKLLEINPRTWKWHSIAKKARKPFLETLYNLTFNQEIPLEVKPQMASFRHFTTDIPVMLKLLLRGQLPKTYKQNIQLAVWDKNDIMPSIFELLYLPYFILNR